MCVLGWAALGDGDGWNEAWDVGEFLEGREGGGEEKEREEGKGRGEGRLWGLGARTGDRNWTKVPEIRVQFAKLS